MADMFSTFAAMWLHLFGPDMEEKIASVFLFSVGFGMTAMNLFGYIACMIQSVLKDINETSDPKLYKVKLARSREEAKQLIIILVAFVGIVGLVVIVMLDMKATTEDQPFIIYLGFGVTVSAEVVKTLWPLWVRYGEWHQDRFVKATPFIYWMKQVQSVLLCLVSAVEWRSHIPDELTTSTSVEFLRIASLIVMLLSAVQVVCRLLIEPVIGVVAVVEVFYEKQS